MTTTEHRQIMALCRVESILRKALRETAGTAEAEYVRTNVEPALKLIDEYCNQGDSHASH